MSVSIIMQSWQYPIIVGDYLTFLQIVVNEAKSSIPIPDNIERYYSCMYATDRFAFFKKIFLI